VHTGPQIRAGVTKVVLAHRATLSSELRRGLEERLGPDPIHEIESAFNTGWVDAQIHIALLDALHAELGSEGLQEYFCSVYVESLSRMPLVRTVVDATLRLFGASPGHLAKTLPRVWHTLGRDVGSWNVAAGKGEAQVVLEGLPPDLARSTSYVWTFAGTFDGFFAQTRVDGEVRIEPGRWDEGNVTYDLSWN